MNKAALVVISSLLVLVPGCVLADFNMRLFSDFNAPLQEVTLQGSGEDKILIVPVTGFINDEPESGLVVSKPSLVQEIVSHLDKASLDPTLRALVLQIDSPGGTVTSSDVIYNEIRKFKQRTGATVVASMMDVAASGGYYIACAADSIVAHPTSVTGSIGVIFMRPNLSGLMDKIGVEVEVTKSGSHKDMGSPFRNPTKSEQNLFQEMIDDYFASFVDIVSRGRNLPRDEVAALADGRVFTGRKALSLKLVDKTGGLREAIDEAIVRANLSTDARIVVYRRTPVSDDNYYNRATAAWQPSIPPLVDLGIDRMWGSLTPGFYYLWLPEATGR